MAEKKKQTYAQAIAELEEIVTKLQNNECEIDELKTYTNRSLSFIPMNNEYIFVILSLFYCNNAYLKKKKLLYCHSRNPRLLDQQVQAEKTEFKNTTGCYPEIKRTII